MIVPIIKNKLSSFVIVANFLNSESGLAIVVPIKDVLFDASS